MHPILFEIPLAWPTVVFFALLLGFGGLVRTRFAPADRNASYLAEFLGLNVRWGVVQGSWAAAAKQAAQSALTAALIGGAVKWVATEQLHKQSIPLHIYGLMMATAFIVGIGLSMRQARREGLPDVVLRDADGFEMKDSKGRPLTLTAAELVSDLGFHLLVAGLIGSRVLYIITRWDAEYAREPAKVLRIWEGGLVWYGGLIAATLVAYRFVRKHRISFWPYADILVSSVSLGHGIGRLGCFAAGCCFGNVARDGFPLTVRFPAESSAWAQHVKDHLISSTAVTSLPVYPTQLFEAGGELLIFLTLLWIRTRKRFHGQVLLSYFFLYPLLRTVIEMFRGDAIRGFVFKWPAEGPPMLLSTSQAVSILVAAAGFTLTIVLGRRAQATAETPSSKAA
jgi:phosphatidylglycerol:prolipoprotein diacylglycerol transferase